MERKNPVDFLLGAVAVLSFLGMAFTVFLQILTRRMTNVSFVWTEELSRFLFILGVAFAAPLAFKSGDFVYIEFLIDHPANRIRRGMKRTVKIITFFVFAIIAYKGIFLIRLGFNQKSSAMGIPMAIPYSFLVIAAFFIVCNIFADFLKALSKRLKRWE